MDKPNARHLKIETQNHLRRQAIRLRKQGKRVCDISAYLGLHPNTVSAWWSEYIDAGEAALYQQKRGRELGEGRTLSPSEETMVVRRNHHSEPMNKTQKQWNDG